MSSIILLNDELELLTGKVRTAAQMRVLRALGVPYRRRPDGSIVVFRRDVEAPPAKREAREPQLIFPDD